MYTLRDKNGVMKAKISERGMEMVFANAQHKRVLMKFKSGKQVMTLTITEDGKLYSGLVEVFLWEGDYIELYGVK